MTRDEFLQQLKEALENDLQGAVVQENVDYYNQYISEEVQKGTLEKEVIETLGDPWVLAKTVIDTVGNKNHSSGVYESQNAQKSHNYQQNKKSNRVYFWGLDTKWKRWLALLAVIVVIMIVIAIIGGLISLLAPVLVPLLVIMLLVRLLSRR